MYPKTYVRIIFPILTVLFLGGWLVSTPLPLLFSREGIGGIGVGVLVGGLGIIYIKNNVASLTGTSKPKSLVENIAGFVWLSTFLSLIVAYIIIVPRYGNPRLGFPDAMQTTQFIFWVNLWFTELILPFAYVVLHVVFQRSAIDLQPLVEKLVSGRTREQQVALIHQYPELVSDDAITILKEIIAFNVQVGGDTAAFYDAIELIKTYRTESRLSQF